jgi:hypothetical protein
MRCVEGHGKVETAGRQRTLLLSVCRRAPAAFDQEANSLSCQPSLSSGYSTVSLMVAECANVPEVPVTVTS